MKKIISAALLLLCTAVGMQAADRKVSKITSTSGTEESYDHYLYNAEGKLIWVQSSTTGTRDVYQYNAEGQLVTLTTLSWIPNTMQFKELNRETYTYDAEGQLLTKDEVNSIGTSYERHYVYSDYKFEDGKAMSWHMEDVRPNVTYKYDYRVILTRNDKGQIVTENVEELDYDYPEDGFCAYEGSTFTYKENGDIDTEVRNKYNYSYDKIRRTDTYSYAYSDLAPEFTPQNLTAKAQAKSIQLTWDAVEGATGYAITYDLEHVVVEGTDFTATDISVGEHEFTVQAIIGGEEKNMATPVKAALADPGKLPAQNLQIGTPRKSVEDTDEGTPRTFYVLPLTWEIPNGHSEIKEIRIYYTSAIYGTIYQAVGSKSATSYELKLDEYDVRRTDEKGEYTGGADMDFYVTIIYGSGESEASNIVTLNPYNLVNGLDTPDAICSPEVKAEQTAETYNLSGQRAGQPHKGIVIKGGKKVAVKA